MTLVTYKDLTREASILFKVHPRDIEGRFKFHFALHPRFAIWHALHSTGSSYSQIGRWFNRDHTTIINGVKRATRLMETNHDYRAKVLALTRYKQGENQ